MDRSVTHEKFPTRRPPRCLVRTEPVNREIRMPLRRAVWPLRATFEGWALKLLVARSGRTG